MKTKHILDVTLPGRQIEIPAGLKVIPASNLPRESKIKYWLRELTPAMEADTEFESYHRNYGIGLTEGQVMTDEEYDKSIKDKIKKFKKRDSKSFKLFIQDSGDRSVGINPSSFEIETFYPEMDDDYRAATKELFSEAVRKLTDFPIRICNFESECMECGSEMDYKKRNYICSNPKCISNQEEEF